VGGAGCKYKITRAEQIAREPCSGTLGRSGGNVWAQSHAI